MQTFDQSLARTSSSEGVIDLREAMNAASNPHDLKIMLERRGGPDRSVRGWCGSRTGPSHGGMSHAN